MKPPSKHNLRQEFGLSACSVDEYHLGCLLKLGTGNFFFFCKKYFLLQSQMHRERRRDREDDFPTNDSLCK